MKYRNINLRKGSQSGFTLIELLTVVVILGILAYVSMNAFSGSPDSANATAIRSTATELAKGVGYLNANIGTGIRTTSSTNNPLIASGGKTMMDVLVIGSSQVDNANRGTSAQTYRERFESLGMRPLESEISVLARPDSGAGKYAVLNYPIEFVDSTSGSDQVNTCPARKVCVKFEKVTTPVLKELLGRFGMKYTESASTDADAPVAYSAPNASDLTHSVTVKLVP